MTALRKKRWLHFFGSSIIEKYRSRKIRLKRVLIKGKQRRANEDIISDLPVDVIALIFGKMPIREAVRTSVLSKKWRFYYLHIPKLVFDDQFFEELDDFLVMKGFDPSTQKYYFDEIITKFLLLHRGGIERFIVHIPYINDSTVVSSVNKWILYLSWINIKKLTLVYKEVCRDLHKLPPYFFSCLDLDSLDLDNFVLSPPLEFEGFLNLQRLMLFRIEFANDCFQSFISSCPKLRTLALIWCSGIHHFNISGSNLEHLYLVIKVDDKFKSISLENTPSLIKVSVFLERTVTDLEGNPVSDFLMFMGSLPKVQILRLNGRFLQLLAETPVPVMLSTSPEFLKILEIKSVNFMDLGQMSVIVCLLRSAPNLEVLYIEASSVEITPELVSGYLEHLDYINFSLRELHFAKLTKISGFAPEFEFIRFLLLSSPSLVTLSILEHPQLEAEEALDIARKLLQFRPPSAVSIEFLDSEK